MKYKLLIIVLTILITACNNLNLNPLSEGSSENWYSNQTEIEMALNDLYRSYLWPLDNEDWTDNWTYRNALSAITAGTINGEWGTSINLWKNSYKGISRANTILRNLKKSEGEISPDILTRYRAEAKFIRASIYSMLISKFGDVVFYKNTLSLEEAFKTGKTEKKTILEAIYNDFDYASEKLPISYNGGIQRATKGAALGMKARIALYNKNWSIARKAAKDCINLGVYSLYPNFGELFLSKTKNSSEIIFAIPRSVELDVSLGSDYPIRAVISRNAGGWGAWTPSWDLLASFLCDDGLPIDESPRFDSHDPFKNRDPRCNMTIVPFQTEHLGFMYQPHPDSTQIMNFKTGKYQYNNDCRSNQQYASYNGLLWKKGVDEDWSDDKKADPDKIILRYADILLMYAESCIEMDKIDQSVLDAMNMVRARAYGMEKINTDSYPEITTSNQDELRKIVRIERRMEFAYEGLRYMDLIRWGLADKALNSKIYGMLDPNELHKKIITKGLWFWPQTPEIDEDGLPNFSSMETAGLVKVLAIRSFDASRQYLWPIPTKEILINKNLDQNSNY